MNALANDLSVLKESSRRFLSAQHRLFIDGEFVTAESSEAISVTDPSSGLVVAQVPDGGAKDIDKAVTAARRAFDEGPWRRMTGPQRERILLKLADLLEVHATEISEIESVNSGRKLIDTRRFDVDLSVDYLRYMAGWTTKLHGETYNPSVPYVPGSKFFAMTVREPVGVIGAITPWNVPLGQAIWKIAPALAAGCTLVLKPAEQTPLTALRFAELLVEAEVPKGVVNIVTGYGETAGAALVAHPGIDKIAFTGSTEVGRKIGESAARQMKRFTLELGGKSPVVILPDANLDIAIPGAAMAIFGNQGQNCCAGSRLFAHQSIYDDVVKGVAKIAERIKLGPALAPDTEMGPLVSKAQQRRVLSYIQSGEEQGAQVVTGGRDLPGAGAYVQPTVLTNVRPDMTCVREEIFGPVLAATGFADLHEVMQRANDTAFGLGASVWTENISSAHWFISQFKAGTVWVNTHGVLDLAVPFGGVKASGIGHELGVEAINHHTHLKSVFVALRDPVLPS